MLHSSAMVHLSAVRVLKCICTSVQNICLSVAALVCNIPLWAFC